MPSGDAQEVADIFHALAESVPPLIRSLFDLLYSPEAGTRMGEAAGGFYKQLVDSGIPADQALELTREYLAPLRTLQDLMKNR